MAGVHEPLGGQKLSAAKVIVFRGAKQLAELIRASFKDSAPPDRMVECSCQECVDVQRYLETKLWTTLTANGLFSHGVQLPLLSVEAFHYYLPAYMVASLGDEPEAWDVRAETIYILTGPRDERMKDWFSARFDRLSSDEHYAVTEFLAEVATSDGALAAEASVAHGVWEKRMHDRGEGEPPSSA